jgi:phage anti-repressor protein
MKLIQFVKLSSRLESFNSLKININSKFKMIKNIYFINCYDIDSNYKCTSARTKDLNLDGQSTRCIDLRKKTVGSGWKS